MKGNSLGYRIKKDFQRNWSLYLLVLPVIIFYAIFMYKPMYGAIIAFKDYTPAKGVFGSEWVGMENFTRFFSSPYFGRLLRNTLLLSIYSIIFGFPAPIILALLLNEVKGKKFKKVSQTITYLPHFISLVVACGMIKDFCLTTGLFNDIIALFGGTRVPLLQDPAYFRTIIRCPAYGRRWAGAPSSIFPHCRAWTASCMKPPLSTERANGSSCCT